MLEGLIVRRRAAADEVRWFDHPPGLTILFLTEMWEKFSFYGMRALLIYYMTKQLLLSQQHASMIYGLYTAFVYFTPMIGGAVADRWLGRRRAVIIGGAIMASGHFMMAFEPLLYPALATIAIGNGLFLPSLPSQITGLYHSDDPRRGSAYSVYYVGINLGAFLAPLVCGTLGEVLGWHWGFGAAGVGMIAGLVIYVAGGAYLPPEPARAVAATKAPPFGAADLGDRIVALAGVWAAVVVFRIAYEQTGNTIALWADQGVTRNVVSGGWAIPMTWFQSLNPLLVFLLTPPLVANWTWRAARGRDWSAARKMTLGAGIVCVAFLAMAAICACSHGHRVSWLWLAGFFVVLTVGELHILPVGLGLFGRLAPPGMAATTIAAWFFAAFAGNLLAGAAGTLWSRIPHAHYFALMAVAAGLATVILGLLDRSVRRIDAVTALAGAPVA